MANVYIWHRHANACTVIFSNKAMMLYLLPQQVLKHTLVADIKIEGSGMNPTTPPMAAPPTETPPNTTSTPPLNVVPKPETGQPTEEPFMEQADCSMPRRLLLDNEVLEEEDNVSDVSGAGNEMGCSNLKVEKVITYLLGVFNRILCEGFRGKSMRLRKT